MVGVNARTVGMEILLIVKTLRNNARSSLEGTLEFLEFTSPFLYDFPVVGNLRLTPWTWACSDRVFNCHEDTCPFGGRPCLYLHGSRFLPLWLSATRPRQHYYWWILPVLEETQEYLVTKRMLDMQALPLSSSLLSSFISFLPFSIYPCHATIIRIFLF